MYFIEEGQRGLLSPFLEFWTLELLQHYSNMTLVTPVTIGPASSEDLLYSIYFYSVMGVPNRCCIPLLGADQSFVCSNLGFFWGRE